MLELIFYGGMSCSTLMQGRGIWSCPNLMCQTLLTLHGSPYSLGRVDGVVDLGEGGLGRGVGEELQLKYKMKFKRMYVILKKERETTHTHPKKNKMHHYVQFANGDSTYKILTYARKQMGSLIKSLLCSYDYYLHLIDNDCET